MKPKFRRRKTYAGLADGHLRQLLTGAAVARFFVGLTPGVDDFGDDADAMQRAWQDREVRGRVEAYQRKHYPQHKGSPFAAIAFGPEGKRTRADQEKARQEYQGQAYSFGTQGGNKGRRQADD